MPTFQYKCKKCNNKFEIFHAHQKAIHKVEEERKEKCPKCGSESVKIPSGFSFRI